VLAHLLGTACLAAVAHTTSASAQTVPTCRLGAGILQIVGLTLTYTAGNGDANDVRVVKTGGTYTPGNTDGIPPTQATYRISDVGAGGFNAVETECASDPGRHGPRRELQVLEVTRL
jgi:hypothetical protein